MTSVDEDIQKSKIHFIGRWAYRDGEFISDWPCSALKFNVELDSFDSTL